MLISHRPLPSIASWCLELGTAFHGGGSPIYCRWLISGKIPIYKWMMTGGTHIFQGTFICLNLFTKSKSLDNFHKGQLRLTLEMRCNRRPSTRETCRIGRIKSKVAWIKTTFLWQFPLSQMDITKSPRKQNWSVPPPGLCAGGATVQGE